MATPVLPYVYKLTERNTGEFYFGYRCANKKPALEDLGIDYFTSSKYVAPNFLNFNYEIIAEFYDSTDAYWFEQELIAQFWRTPGILNKKYQKKDNLKEVFRKTGPLSEEHKKKVSVALKKHQKTPEHIKNAGLGQRNKTKTQQHREALRIPKTITAAVLAAHNATKLRKFNKYSCIMCKDLLSENKFNLHYNRCTNKIKEN